MTSLRTSYRFRFLVAILALGVYSGTVGIASAAIFVQTKEQPRSQDIFFVDVYLNTERKRVNVVEGTVSLDDGKGNAFSITDVVLADSVLQVWPRTPSLSADGHSVSFVGGVPAGINEPKALLFRLAVQTSKPGTIRVNTTAVGYLSDGKGTAVAFTNNSDTVSVAASGLTQVNAAADLISKDNTPPALFEVLLGQDASIYNGMKFLTFATTDSGSGVDYYEVTEIGYAPTRTGTTYVLQNQDSVRNITVTARDKAGNIRTVVFHKTWNWTVVILVSVLISAVAVFGFVFRKKCIAFVQTYVFRKKHSA